MYKHINPNGDKYLLDSGKIYEWGVHMRLGKFQPGWEEAPYVWQAHLEWLENKINSQQDLG